MDTPHMSEPSVQNSYFPYRQSFAGWHKLLERIHLHTYWQTMPDRSDGSAHNEWGRDGVPCQDNSDKPSKPVSGSSKMAPLSIYPSCDSSKFVKHSGWINESSQESDKSPPRRGFSSHHGAASRRRNRSRKKSSSSSSQSSSTASSSSSEQSSSESSSSGRKRRRSRHSKRVTREVVPPCIFDPNGGLSFKQFLRDFERYFDAKFQGNDRDRSHHIREFLDETMKRTYDVLDGQQKKYKHIKPDLIEIHNAGKCSSRDKKYRAFHNASLLSSETLRGYCVRLEQLAKKAYPDSRKERVRQLHRKFMATIPQSFVGKFEGAQDALSAFGRGRLSWDKIKSIAESADRNLRKREEVGMSGLYPEVGVWYNRGQSPSPTPAIYQPSPPRKSRISAAESATPPTFTGYHGARPKMRGPSNDVPNSSREASPVTTGASGLEVVPYRFHERDSSGERRGSGYGRGLPHSAATGQRHNRGLPCTWCGRNSHTEARCWIRQGACLSCGDMNHQAVDCPRSQRFKASRISCPICSGDHLGRDCGNPSALN